MTPKLPLLREIADAATSLTLRDIRSFLVGLAVLPRLWGNRVSVTFTGAGELAVSHGLGYSPSGYVVEGLTADIRIYDGAAPATSSTINLKSTGAGTARLWIF